MEAGRERWGSRTGFLLAAIGSAIGLGNIWRFGYVCYKNGAGAFLIPYFVALFVGGISLLLLEYAVGHRYRGSAPVAYRQVGKRWEWTGWMTINLAMFGILVYYAVVLAWCFNFLFYSFNLSWGADPGRFFNHDFLQITSGPFEFGSMRWPIVGTLFLVWFLNWLTTFMGVRRGIELACKIFIPVLFVLAIVLVIRGVTLPGAELGIKWYLTPNFAALKDFRVWQAAFSQIFFSIGVGFGIMIAYASYVPPKSNLVANSRITALTNSGFELFMAFAVFGTLGYMSKMTGLAASEVVQTGPTLAFVVFPKAISLMPVGQHLFAILFFVSLLIAGLTSSISILEGFASGLMDKFNLSRGKAVTVLASVGFLLGLVYCTGAGLYWLDIVDHFIMSYAALPIAAIECFVFGWLLKGTIGGKSSRGARLLRDHVNAESATKVGVWWVWVIRIVIPAMLLTVTGFGIYGIFTEGYGGYPTSALVFIGLGSVALFLILAFVLSARPWSGRQGEKWAAEASGD